MCNKDINLHTSLMASREGRKESDDLLIVSRILTCAPLTLSCLIAHTDDGDPWNDDDVGETMAASITLMKSVAHQSKCCPWG